MGVAGHGSGGLAKGRVCSSRGERESFRWVGRLVRVLATLVFVKQNVRAHGDESDALTDDAFVSFSRWCCPTIARRRTRI